MIKHFSPSDWPLTHESVHWVKTAAAGFRGYDLKEFRKSAGEIVADLVKRAMEKRLPGEEMLVVNAMGATEIEGPNRNGDGFKLDTLAKSHSTFKSAKWYRDHNTTGPSYGRIPEAVFDPSTGRVPVCVALNATKEAAERNGGKVADLELNDIHSSRPIKVSMSCSVRGDCCSSCGNFAKSRDEYCTESMCKHGGCKNNLGRVSEDGHILHVDNPDPTFFDLSRISTNQAGRTAFVYGRVKSAAVATYDVAVGDAWIGNLVRKLAAEEQRVEKKGNVYVPSYASATREAPDYTAVSALVARSGILSVADWDAAFGVRLPNVFGIYTKLASTPRLLAMTPAVIVQQAAKEATAWAAEQKLVAYDRSTRIKAAAVASLLGSRHVATPRSVTMTEAGLEYVAYQLATLLPHVDSGDAVAATISNNFSSNA